MGRYAGNVDEPKITVFVGHARRGRHPPIHALPEKNPTGKKLSAEDIVWDGAT